MDEPNLDATGELIRPYVITNGRELPQGTAFTMTTLVTATEEGLNSRVLTPESRRILDLCSGGYLSVVEVAGHTKLPLGVVRILLTELTESGFMTARAPVPVAQRADEKLLQDVLSGLKARFGA